MIYIRQHYNIQQDLHANKHVLLKVCGTLDTAQIVAGQDVPVFQYRYPARLSLIKELLSNPALFVRFAYDGEWKFADLLTLSAR